MVAPVKNRIRRAVVPIAVLAGILGLLPGCFDGIPFLESESGGGANETAALAALVLGGGLGSAGSSGSSSSSTAACSSGSAPADPAYLADTVTSAPGATGSGFGDSSKATNGICGQGTSVGSTDVFSLDATGSGASITLEWAGKKVTNGTGIDFVVFENAFYYGGNSSTVFMEAIIVEVSQDNSSWCGFAPNYTNGDETTYSTNPSVWSNFAGKTAVYYNRETNPLSASAIFDASQAGGDGFDLDNLSDDNSFGIGCSTTLRNDIRDTNGFVYLRLTAASNRTNADTAANFLQDPGAFNGPDIDGVVGRHLTAR